MIGRDVVVLVDVDLDAAVAAGGDAAALGAAEGDGHDAVDVGQQDGHADRHNQARDDGRDQNLKWKKKSIITMGISSY